MGQLIANSIQWVILKSRVSDKYEEILNEEKELKKIKVKVENRVIDRFDLNHSTREEHVYQGHMTGTTFRSARRGLLVATQRIWELSEQA